MLNDVWVLIWKKVNRFARENVKKNKGLFIIVNNPGTKWKNSNISQLVADFFSNDSAQAFLKLYFTKGGRLFKIIFH